MNSVLLVFFICTIFISFSLLQVLQLTDGRTLSSRLIIDAMGNFSPVVKQVEFPIILLEMRLCFVE